jgi:membrane protease YdiL (CAAX protease family)
MSLLGFSTLLHQFFVPLVEMSAVSKITAFFLGWLLFWLPIAIPLGMRLKWKPFREGTSAAQKLPLVASLYLLAPAMLWGAAILEEQPFSVYGLSWAGSTFRSIAFGWLFGVLGLAVMFLVQGSLGWLKFRSLTEAPNSEALELSDGTVNASVPSLQSIGFTAALMLILGLWISITEELVFRGFLLNQLAPNGTLHELQDISFGFSLPWLAATIASLIFALLHLIWEGYENIPQLPGLWLMGMVLCLARWVDGGSLGLACGLHAGWVWAIACLDTAQVLRYPGKVPEWVTGMGGKPLAGVTGILFLLMTGLGLFFLGGRL